MSVLHTTLGPHRRDQLGMILPHEHVFVDLRTPDQPGHGQADAADVVALMAPQVVAAAEAGVTAIVECSTGGVGRRADLDLAVSEATGMPIVMATGIYREPWIPPWAAEASDAELERWMVGELTTGIERTGVVAAWIKLSAGDGGMTPLEQRILRAAARASAATGAVIGSHTIRGRVVLEQLDVIEAEGGSATRFIWIHTQAEPDLELHDEVAARGAYIEYDHVGQVEHEHVVDLIMRALEHGHGPRLLVSHDAGWFDPAQPGGGVPRPYTALSTDILPRLRARGVTEATIAMITEETPFNAYAR
jgi:phosphotriesterase-related protein